MSQKKKSLLESIPVLILLGILAGAVGGYGVGWMQLRTLNSAAASAAK
jgi:type II secretory pathway pseudopilin PulG